MGLGNRERKTYLKLSKGKFRKTVDQNTPGAVKVAVTDDDGNIRKYNYELQWDWFTGKVMAAKIIANAASDKYPDNFCLFMDDETGEHYIIQVSTESGLYTKLLNKLSNPALDFNKPITLQAYFFESENKSAIVVSQNEVKIEPFFTREAPNGMPELPEGVIDASGKIVNKDKWKMYLINVKVFLSDYFFKNIKIDPFSGITPEHNEETNTDGAVPPESDFPPKTNTTTSPTKEEGDDLPF